MITPPSMVKRPQSGVASKAAPKPLSEAEIDALIVRIESAIDSGGEVSSSDLRLLLEALKWVMHLSERLVANDLTIHKLKKLLGIVSASEKSKDLPLASNPNPAGDPDGSAEDEPMPVRGGRPHGKPKANVFTAAAVEHHHHPDFSKGISCPDCSKGKLYKFEPSQFVRATRR